MNRRVLLGIAEPLLAECITNLLAGHHQVFLPQHSYQLVREAEHLQPQLLILDDSLAEDHTTLCLTICRRLPDCKLLFLSASWQASLAAQLQAHGVDVVLRKPFSSNKLLSTIRHLLDATHAK